MSVPIALRGDFNAAQPRGLARKTKDGPQARRLLAVAAIYDGATRTEAAKIGGVGLQDDGAGCDGERAGFIGGLEDLNFGGGFSGRDLTSTAIRGA